MSIDHNYLTVGVGGGFQFKYKKVILELCLMYVAPWHIRSQMSNGDRIKTLRTIINQQGYTRLMQSLRGYCHTIDSRLLPDTKGKTSVEWSTLWDIPRTILESSH